MAESFDSLGEGGAGNVRDISLSGQRQTPAVASAALPQVVKILLVGNTLK